MYRACEFVYYKKITLGMRSVTLVNVWSADDVSQECECDGGMCYGHLFQCPPLQI